MDVSPDSASPLPSAHDADEFAAPLGFSPRRTAAGRVFDVVGWTLAGTMGLALCGFAGWVIAVNDPLGGEPVAIVELAAKPTATAAVDAAPRVSDAPSQAVVRPANDRAGATVTVIDGTSGKREQVSVAGPARSGVAGFDPRLTEESSQGPLPRVAPDGSRSIDVYAGPVPTAAGPRIALVIGRLGIGDKATAEAFTKLPSAVTFAFSPYGADLPRWAARARAEGREALVQAPMEPHDPANNDPGPKALLTSLPAHENVERLRWAMSRMGGYVGIANHMGGRFLTDEGAKAPVLREVASRGLLFFDDGAADATGTASERNGAPFVRADVTLDTGATAADIERALLRLEALARERGSAVGYAAGTPAIIERVARWSKTANTRGIVLVPLTAALAKAKSS